MIFSEGQTVRGLMTIVGVERSDNGASFFVLENESNQRFLVPLKKLLPLLQPVFGTRRMTLTPRSYYGRDVYDVANS